MRTVVVVDSREGGSVRSALQRLGVPIEVRRLTVGDSVAGQAVVERKSVRDLHGSILEKRFWPQIGRLSRAARHPYLLVEGRDLDAGPLRPESVRGAILAVQELGIGLIRTSDSNDSALWLEILASRDRPRRRSARVFATGVSSPQEAMLSAVPGVSTVTARALLARFGSLTGVLAANPSDWLSTPGVGPKRAQALSNLLAPSTRSPSGARSAPPGPST
jgi:DNA excision repair protein ERCC-4